MDAGETLESKINRSEYKILIVDDVVSNVLLLKILLTNEKFQVCTANNGTSCIEMAKKEHPDLILLDVMMPDISGFDTAIILKKDDTTILINNPQDIPSQCFFGYSSNSSSCSSDGSGTKAACSTCRSSSKERSKERSISL